MPDIIPFFNFNGFIIITGGKNAYLDDSRIRSGKDRAHSKKTGNYVQ